MIQVRNPRFTRSSAQKSQSSLQSKQKSTWEPYKRNSRSSKTPKKSKTGQKNEAEAEENLECENLCNSQTSIQQPSSNDSSLICFPEKSNSTNEKPSAVSEVKSSLEVTEMQIEDNFESSQTENKSEINNKSQESDKVLQEMLPIAPLDNVEFKGECNTVKFDESEKILESNNDSKVEETETPEKLNVKIEENKIAEKFETTDTVSIEKSNFKTERKKFPKKSKLSIAFKKKKRNSRLSKLLVPKSAVTLLNELKPGCTYKLNTITRKNKVQFTAEIKYDGKILGIGQGLSKSQCKASAADNAVKNIISEMMDEKNPPSKIEKKNMNSNVEQNSSHNLPWTGLASYALFKLFKDWQKHGMKIPSIPVLKEQSEPFIQNSVNPEKSKELPPNAAEMHPGTLLNFMIPGLTAVELHRESGQNSRVIMGYTIEGKTYSGEGTNKKDAKRQAAKAAALALWGLKYE